MTRTVAVTVTAPRWARAIRALGNVAASAGLDFKVLWDDRGWFSHTFRAEVAGDALHVEGFITAVKRVMAEYNR